MFVFYIFFMPLLLIGDLMGVNLLFAFFIYVFSSISFFNFFCMLSYDWGVDYVSVVLFLLSTWIGVLMFVASVSIKNSGVGSCLFMLTLLFILFFVSFVFFS